MLSCVGVVAAAAAILSLSVAIALRLYETREL